MEEPFIYIHQYTNFKYIALQNACFFCSWIWLKSYSVSRCPRDDLDWFRLSDDVPQEVQPERCWSDLPRRRNSRPGGFNLRWHNEHEIRQQGFSLIRKVDVYFNLLIKG